MKINEFATYEEYLLKRMTIGMQQYLSLELLKDMDVKVIIDRFSQQACFRISQYVWYQEVKSQTVSYPADWWQALKQRWFPEWALKKWPVKNKVLTIDIRCIYPEFHPAVHGEIYKYISVRRESLE